MAQSKAQSDHLDLDEAALAAVSRLFERLGLPFNGPDFVAALVGEAATFPGTVTLPAAQQEFWDKHSGLGDQPVPDLGAAAAADAAARVIMDARALCASAVAELLGKASSTVRHYKAERKLYAYDRGGRSLFPSWQFTADRMIIPSLGEVLSALPAGLHPQAVAGFFLTTQPDLVLWGKPVSAKEWLERGGPLEPVLQMAHGLVVGI